MSLEAEIFNALKGIVASRVYPDLAPDGVTAPYIVYQYVGGEAVNFVTGEQPSKKNTRVQVAVWAASRVEAQALGAQVENVLRGVTTLQATVLGAPVSSYDQASKLRGALQDFSLWS